jgi:hypothetical protein
MRSTGPPATPTYSILLEPHQHLYRTTRRHHVFVGFTPGLVKILGVVQVHKLQPLQPQQLEATLDRASHLPAGEVAAPEVAVGLGGQHVPVGEAPHLREQPAYSPLALPVAVGGCRIEEVERALEDRAQRLGGSLLGD